MSASSDLSWTIATLSGFSISSSLIIYLAANKFAPGFQRSTLCLAVIAAYFAVPGLLVDGAKYPFLIQGVCCVLSVSAFKVLALCMGRGCLSVRRNFWQFHGVLALPIIPIDADYTPNSADDALKPSFSDESNIKLVQGLLKLGGFAALSLLGLGAWAWDVHQRGILASAVVYNISGLAMLLEIDGMGDLVDAVALRVFRLRAERHFDWPMIKSTSLSDLWARRWNLTISSVLRAAVYDPVIDGQLIAKADTGEEQAPPNPKLSTSFTSNTTSPSMSESPSTDCCSDLSATSLKHSASDAPSSEPSLAASSVSSTGSGTLPSAAAVAAEAAAATAETQNPSPALEPVGEAVAAEAALQPVTVPLSAVVANEGPFKPKAALDRGMMSSSSGGGSSVASGGSSGGKPVRPSKVKRFVGTLCVFIVSGLWHELVCYYMAGKVTGYWFTFFVIQAPVLMVEQQIKKRTKAMGLVLPDWAAVLVTNAAFLTMLQLMWYPPLEQTGMIEKMRSAFAGGLEDILALLHTFSGAKGMALGDSSWVEPQLQSLSWLLRGQRAAQ